MGEDKSPQIPPEISQAELDVLLGMTLEDKQASRPIGAKPADAPASGQDTTPPSSAINQAELDDFFGVSPDEINADESIAGTPSTHTDNQSSAKPSHDKPLSQADIDALLAAMGNN